MKVGDVVAWTPTRMGAWCAQKVKFVGVVTGVHLAGSWSTNEPHIYVLWNESTIPTLNDPRDVKVIEVTNESR
mgnify:FL=1